jgi:hypothetical protein
MVNLAVVLNCGDLLTARAAAHAPFNDIKYLVYSDSNAILQGPGSGEITAPIERCHGNETITLDKELYLRVSSLSLAYSQGKTVARIEPATSEPLKQNWSHEFSTTVNYDMSTVIEFAQGLTELKVNNSRSVPLVFENFGNAKLNVTPIFKSTDGAPGDCGIAIPPFSIIHPIPQYQARTPFQFTVVLLEPTASTIHCMLSLHVSPMLDDESYSGQHLPFTIDGPSYNLENANGEENQSSNSIAILGTLVALAISQLLVRVGFKR